MLWVIVLAIGIMAYLIGRIISAMAKESGRQEALREAAENAAALDKARAEEMMKEKTVEEVASSLDDGEF